MESFKTLLLGTPPTRTYTASATGLLTSANNLSDVADAATSRTNLGLGTTTTAFNSITAASATNLTLAGGSSGASLVLGQGANGAITLTPAGTGRLIFNGAITSTGVDLRYDSTGTGALSFQNRTDGTGAFAQLLVGTSANSIFLQQFSTSYTTTGSKIAGSGRLHGQGTLSILGQSGVAIWTGNDGSETRRAEVTGGGNLLIGGTTDISGSGGLKIFGTTAATSTTTGAFQCAGGAGIAGSVYAAGFATAGNLTLSAASNARIYWNSGQTAWIDYTSETWTFRHSGTGTTSLTLSSSGNATVAGNLTVSGTGTSTFAGPISTSAPTGGAGAWELGVANAVTPTSPNRTITIEIGGTVYYLHAKTTND